MNDVCPKTFRDFDSYNAAFKSFMQSLTVEYKQKLDEFARKLEIEQFERITYWIKGHDVDQTPA